MSLLVMPAQLARRSELYQNLSQLTHAGITLHQALETQLRSAPSAGFREPLARILGRLREGSTFTESALAAGPWLPSFDQALLNAGERSGRLPACFRLLAEFYAERAQLAREVIADLMYPLFLFHFAVLLAPLPKLFLSGGVWGYALSVGLVLLPVYALVLFLLLACQGRHGESWRALMERLGQGIPLLGSARRNLAIARLCSALDALLNAGVPIIETWEISAAASGSPALRRTVQPWRPRLENGETPAQLVRESPCFPEVFQSMYHTGEISGTLDDSIRRLGTLHRENGTRQLRAFARWVPRLVYLLIVLTVAYRIVSFYMGYFGQINSILGP